MQLWWLAAVQQQQLLTAEVELFCCGEVAFAWAPSYLLSSMSGWAYMWAPAHFEVAIAELCDGTVHCWYVLEATGGFLWGAVMVCSRYVGLSLDVGLGLSR